VLDGGPCAVGVESTIVDVSGQTAAILRPGGITRERVCAILGAEVPVLSESPVRVPGQLPSHYAPSAQVVLVTALELAERVASLRAEGRRVGALAPRGTASGGADVEVIAQDSAELARGLYAALRRFDDAGCDVVVAVVPDTSGLGLAVADRLRRAAGPRG
jgi:L-threonylcarbamoyladenylate synthase